jgi:hypothetical protein
MGFFPSVVQPIPTSVPFKEIAYSYHADLQIELNCIPVRAHIDTGSFAPCDLYISLSWLQKYLSAVPNCVIDKDKTYCRFLNNRRSLYASGNIENLKLKSNGYEFEFQNLSFVCIDYEIMSIFVPKGNDKFKKREQLVDCVPTKQFIEKLFVMNVIPCLV